MGPITLTSLEMLDESVVLFDDVHVCEPPK